jgi:hypothetical protein
MGIRPVKLIYNFELDKDVKFESLRCLPTSSRQSFLGNAAVTAFATMSPSAFTFAMTAAPAEAAAPVGSPWNGDHERVSRYLWSPDPCAGLFCNEHSQLASL